MELRENVHFGADFGGAIDANGGEVARADTAVEFEAGRETEIKGTSHALIGGGVNSENKFTSSTPSHSNRIGENGILTSVVIARTDIELESTGHFFGVIVVGSGVASDGPDEAETATTTLTFFFFFPFFVEVGIRDT